MGLLGYNYHVAISNCYASTSVIGRGESIGGLVWSNYAGISNSYTTGSVTGDDGDVGGLVGWNTAAINTPFWDTDISLQSSMCGRQDHGGSGCNNANGKTTTEMHDPNTFILACWDFVSVWDICEGTNYPKLVWSIPAGDFLCPDGVSFSDYAFLAERWLMTDYGDVGGVELTGDGKIDLNDFARFAEYWRVTGCGDCGGADYTGEGDVDVADLEVFTGVWLGSEYGNCEGAELSGDGKVGAEDLGAFAENWLAGF